MKNTMNKQYKVHKRNRSNRHTAIRTVILLTVVVIGILSFSFGSFFSSAHDSETADQTRCYKTIEVKYGDTLWSIAEENMDDHYDSVQEYIAELTDVNHLEDRDPNMIREGTFLTVVYYK